MSLRLDELDESQQAGYSSTTPSEQQSIAILSYLLDKKFVKSRLDSVDKTPNIDGTLELTDLNQKQKGKLEVQVKTLQKKDFLKPKYQCEMGFLAYCNNSILPVLLIVVNQEEDCAYWLHMNKAVLLDAVKKMKGRTVSVAIPISNKIDRSGTAYLEPWAMIIAQLKQKIDGYDEVLKAKEDAEDRMTILEEKIQSLMGAQFGSILTSENMAFHLSAEIDNVKMLRRNGDYTAALRILENERQNKWESMTDEQRYGLTVQMVVTEFGLLNYHRAADLLDGLESYTVGSDQKEGLISLRFLIRGDLNNAEIQAREALRKNPKDSNAYLTLLKIRAEMRNRGEEMQLEIPESLKAMPAIQWALARELEEVNDVDAALEIYESVDWNTVEDYVEKMDILGSWASSLIQSIRYSELLMQGGGVESDIQKAEKALTLFDETLSFFKDTQLHSTRYYLYINRAIVNKLLRRPDQSDSDFKKAYELHPSYITARYLMFNRPKAEIHEWIDIARKMPMSADNEIELAQVESELLLSSDRAEEALEVLGKVTNFVDRSGNGDGYYYILLADVLFQLNRMDEVKEVQEKLRSLREDGFAYVVVSAKYAIVTNDELLLNSFVPKLLAVAEKMNHVWVRTSIFGLLISVRRYREAAEVYRPLVNPNDYSVYARKLVECLVLSKMYKEAVQRIEQFLSIGASDGFLVDALSSIYDECKSRESAVEVVERYLKTHNSLLLQVKLALLYIAKNDFDRAVKQLKEFPPNAKLRTELSLLLAQAYLRCDMGKGLILAYNTLMENENLPAINNAFTDLIARFCLFRPELKDPLTVSIDSYVKLDSQGNAMEIVVVPTRQFQDEIGAADELFTAIYGKKIGDTVFFDGQQLTIRKIKSKYRAAYDRAKGFSVGKGSGESVIGSTDGNVGEEEFRKIYEELAGVIAECIQQSMPFELLAARIGSAVIEFQQEFVAEFGIPRLAMASEREYLDFIKQPVAKCFLFDIFSCLALEELDAWDMLNVDTSRKIVSSTVVRQIQDHIGALHVAKGWKEIRHFRMVSGKPCERVISREEMEARMVKMEAFLKKVMDHFEVVEGDIPEDHDQFTWSQSHLGQGNTDILRLAKKEGACVISDDPFWRGYLSFREGILCGSLASFSIYLSYTGRRSNESHTAFLATLLARGYEGVPVDGNVIKACIVLDDYQNGKATQAALREIVDMGTGMFDGVLEGIFTLCLDKGIDAERKKILFTNILLGIGAKNWSRDWKTIFWKKIENSRRLRSEDRELLESVVESLNRDERST